MANLYIAEYATLPHMSGGQAMIAPEPAIATQKVSFTGTPGRSAAFNAQTKYIGVTADGIFSYAVGTAAIDATTSHFRVPADQIIFMGVSAGDRYISAITNT